MYTRDPDTSYKVTNTITLNLMNRKCLIMQVNRCRKLTAVLAAGAMNRAHANILRWWCFGQFKFLKRNMHTKCSTRLIIRIRGSRVLLKEILNAITETRETKKCIFLMHCWVSYTSTIMNMPLTAGQIKWPFLLGSLPSFGHFNYRPYTIM